MVELNLIKKHLPHIGLDLQQAFAAEGTLKDFDAHTEVLQQGQHVTMIPLGRSIDYQAVADVSF